METSEAISKRTMKTFRSVKSIIDECISHVNVHVPQQIVSGPFCLCLNSLQLFPASRRASAASCGGVSYYSRASRNSVDNTANGGDIYVEPDQVLRPSLSRPEEHEEELSLHALLSFGRQITLGMVSRLYAMFKLVPCLSNSVGDLG